MQNDRSYIRYELKYRLDYFTYLKMRNAIQIHMRKDAYTRAAPGKGYLVRSLYYDSHEYQAYHEKMSGDNERIKLRIRTYVDTPGPDAPIRIELKGRQSNIVIKESCFVNYADYQQFARRSRWPAFHHPALEQFQEQICRKSLQPKIVIEYLREGYASRSKDDLRITFDHEVRSACASQLFPQKPYFRQHHNHHVTLEIKFHHDPDAWLFPLIQRYGLKHIANSKFTQGIQLARPDLHHSEGIIYVR